MHRCYPECRDGFHYSKSTNEPLGQQEAQYYGTLKKQVDKHFAKDLPRPDNFERLDYQEFGPYLVLKLNYPNCTNFGGDKVLVVKAPLKDFIVAKHIDPHFAAATSTKARSLPPPEARFPPTKQGWENACKFASLLANSK